MCVFCFNLGYTVYPITPFPEICSAAYVLKHNSLGVAGKRCIRKKLPFPFSCCVDLPSQLPTADLVRSVPAQDVSPGKP